MSDTFSKLEVILVFRWRRLMSEGGKEAVRADDAGFLCGRNGVRSNVIVR